MDDSDTLSGTSEALLPGAGHTPGYGINDSCTSLEESTFTVSHRTTTSVMESRKKDKENVLVVARCALIACLASFVCGIAGGFSSPTLLELGNNNITTSPAQFLNLSDELLPSLFGSLSAIGAMFGGLVAWPVSDLLGRQSALVLGGIPFLTGWIVLANAVQVTGNKAGFLTLLMAGRFLTGVGTGWSIFSVSVYITEISSARWKGRFGNCNQLLQTGGSLLIYLLGINFGGHKIHYYYTALVAAGVTAIFEVGMLTTYETPRWLFSKKRNYQGIKVLKTFRGKCFHIASEIDEIKTSIRRTYSMKEQLLEFRRRAVLHPFILVLFLMFFQQFSGINVAIFYSSQVFSAAGYDSDQANFITFFAVGVVQVIATFFSVVLITFVGQRKLLISSSIGMFISSFLLGIYFYIFNVKCHGHVSQHCSHIQYMAIACMVVFIASFSIGWGPIPWAAMSELLPNQVRSLGGSIATAINWGFATIITLTFKSYSHKVTPEGTWWSFSLIMFISILYVAMFLPETNGLNLEKIQSHFESGQIFVGCCDIGKVRRRIEESVDSERMSTPSKSRSTVN